MKTKRNFEILEKGLKFCLSAVLLLSALTFIFVFVINWEDWFFGIKLDGLAAGVSLLIKGAVAALLFYLLIKYPGRSLIITGVAALYFGYLFIDSAITVQTRTGAFFSPFLLVEFVIPVAAFFIQVVKSGFSRYWQHENKETG